MHAGGDSQIRTRARGPLGLMKGKVLLTLPDPMPAMLDLSRQNLTEADLSRRDLCGAKLVGANPSQASLRGVHLGGADLTRCVLDGALTCQARGLPEWARQARGWPIPHAEGFQFLG